MPTAATVKPTFCLVGAAAAARLRRSKRPSKAGASFRQIGASAQNNSSLSCRASRRAAGGRRARCIFTEDRCASAAAGSRREGTAIMSGATLVPASVVGARSTAAVGSAEASIFRLGARDAPRTSATAAAPSTPSATAAAAGLSAAAPAAADGSSTSASASATAAASTGAAVKKSSGYWPESCDDDFVGLSLLHSSSSCPEHLPAFASSTAVAPAATAATALSGGAAGTAGAEVAAKGSSAVASSAATRQQTDPLPAVCDDDCVAFSSGLSLEEKQQQQQQQSQVPLPSTSAPVSHRHGHHAPSRHEESGGPGIALATNGMASVSTPTTTGDAEPVDAVWLRLLAEARIARGLGTGLVPTADDGGADVDESCAEHGHGVAVDDMWLEVRGEARADAEAEPALAGYINSVVLSHRTLESALAGHMANLLGSPTLPPAGLYAIFRDVLLREDSGISAAMRRDLLAVRTKDPACRSMLHCLLNFKGFCALQAHRVAHHLWNNGRVSLALALQSRVSTVLCVDIHPGARIGSGILLDHATGVVIGETAIIGDDVTMLHNVMLGGSMADVPRGLVDGSGNPSALNTMNPTPHLHHQDKLQDERHHHHHRHRHLRFEEKEQQHPIVGDHVLIGAGARILGPVHIGRGAKVGAGSLVLQDVAEGVTVVGAPARELRRSKDGKPAPAEVLFDYMI